jgi:type I restriction enzyme, S subunit
MAWEGAFGLVPDAADDCVMSGAFVAYELDKTKIEPLFLDWYFRSPVNWQRIGRQSTGTNVRRQSLHPKQFEAAKIVLPPVTEQRKIVKRIETLSAKISEAKMLRREASEALEALAASVSKAAFNRPEWVQVRLEDVCELITDGTHQTPRYVDDGAPFLSAQNVKPFRFMPENHRKVSWEDFGGYTARNKPTKGDVLLTRVGAGIGEAAVIDQDIEFAFYVSVALIRTIRARVIPEFLVHWLNSPLGRAQSRRQTLGRGHSQGNLNLKLLRGFPIPLPPIEEQLRIVAQLHAMRTKIDAVRQLHDDADKEVGAMLPAILDRAFRGEMTCTS